MATVFNPATFTSNLGSVMKEELSNKIQVVAGKKRLILKDVSKDVVAVIVEGKRIASVSFGMTNLDTKPYKLLAFPDSEYEFDGTIGHIAGLISILQQNDFDWNCLTSRY